MKYPTRKTVIEVISKLENKRYFKYDLSHDIFNIYTKNIDTTKTYGVYYVNIFNIVDILLKENKILQYDSEHMICIRKNFIRLQKLQKINE